MLRIAQEALTFDDVLLVPRYSDVLPRDVDLKSRLTRNLTLNIPLLSSAMDTVTEARLAIAMAQEGGIGIIHKSMSINQQAAEVRKVKKHESVIVKDPVTVGPNAKLQDLLEMASEYGYSGFPVVEGETLVGIVTGRDMRFQPDHSDSVEAIMTPRDKLVTVLEGTPLDVIKSKLQENRIEKILVVDKDFHLRGLVTVRDIEKARTYPMAAKDADGRLLVGAAVGTGPETPDRIAALVEQSRKLERELAEVKKALALGGGSAAQPAGPEKIGNIDFLGQVIEGLDPKELRGIVDQNKATLGSGVSAVLAVVDGRASIAVGVTDDLKGQISAVDLVRAGVEALGGKGGGGRPDMAQGGGPDGDKATAALDAVRTALASVPA